MRLIRTFIVAMMIVMAAAPFAFVAAAVLSPLWSWVETATRLESMGHSGPATWCYLATWAALSALGLLAWRAALRGRSAAAPVAADQASCPGH